MTTARIAPAGVTALVLATAALGSRLHAQGIPDYELAPIEYSASEASNIVNRIQARIDSGAAVIATSVEKERMRRCLDEFGIDTATQVLVFSKTSVQRKLIAPHQPRAIYFNDDSYVGTVPGGLIEVTVSDPALGLVFYYLDARQPERRLQFVRDNECLSCHAGSMTSHYPGLMVRSVFPASNGEPITSAGTFLVGHDTPVADRWGGWYVTGLHGNERHMGNVLAREIDGGVTLDRDRGANLHGLTNYFDLDHYLQPGSDIVALMVFEHQCTMHNRIAHAGLKVRRWMHYQKNLQKDLGETVTEEPTGTALRVVQNEAERILEYLLFTREAPLAAPLAGDPRFQTAFRRNRRADGQNRSLKDFDLQGRLFKYRCSYMIYSESFDALPSHLKKQVYRRLQEILSDDASGPGFEHLKRSERRAIREILTETKPDLAAAWKATSGTR